MVSLPWIWMGAAGGTYLKYNTVMEPVRRWQPSESSLQRPCVSTPQTTWPSRSMRMAGQLRLKQSSALIIGPGGLGVPLTQYLGAAGVGRLGIVDFDVIDETNLQRQVLYGTRDVGRKKIEVAKERVAQINPNVDVQTYETRLTSDNALDILRDYDVVIDGTDNF